jgi:hypothetical protein
LSGLATRQIAAAKASNVPAFVATVNAVQANQTRLGQVGSASGFVSASPWPDPLSHRCVRATSKLGKPIEFVYVAHPDDLSLRFATHLDGVANGSRRSIRAVSTNRGWAAIAEDLALLPDTAQDV